MFANRLLSAGTLLLLVRCAMAAEGEHTPPRRMMCCTNLCHIKATLRLIIHSGELEHVAWEMGLLFHAGGRL